MSSALRKPRLPNPDLDTQGRRLFDAAVQSSGKIEQEIAQLLECSKGAVNNWRKGHASPEGVYRSAIEIVFPAIKKEMWDTPAEVAFLARVRKSVSAPQKAAA